MITEAESSQEFYLNFAYIIIEMNNMLGEIKQSCKIEQIMNDLKEFCKDSNCGPKKILMRGISKYMLISQIMTMLIK